MLLRYATAFAAAFSLLAAGCAERAVTAPATPAKAGKEELVPFEQFELENGLKVILHIDRSDPVVAVALTAHVGSAREMPGRTGFAHLFEHLLFLESENLGKGGLDAMSARVGGSGANGSTSRDRTNYFQTVPKDALEKMIWAEADKIGFFINTVTEPVLAKEKQVVKNEKRQSVDNQPYGHTYYVLGKALYPEGHPYNWQVIGSLEDLDAATLDDVREFYAAWYTPNNVTLVIAGDFDPDQARQWAHKYFDEIPRGPDVAPLEKEPVELSETKRLYHEDNFAQLPELTITWPTAPEYHPDSYALNVLADLLSVGKRAPLNQVLIDELKLTSGVGMGGYHSELAGEMILSVRAFDGVDLDDVKSGLDAAFARFEERGVEQKDLDRVKTIREVGFYRSIQSVLGKAFNLAQYEIFAGDPGFINEDIKNIKAVTAEDVMRVYERYIKDKPFVAASFVPKGALELGLEGSERADVVEEEIIQGAEAKFDAGVQAQYERTPSSFDRSKEPPYGEKATVEVPAIWETRLENGLRVIGIQDNELPLVTFELAFDGGHLLDDLDTPGAANLLAEIMDKGAAKRDTAELEEAIDSLGASIDIGAGEESFAVSGSTLARNFEATMALVEEILLEPRWDAEELALAKTRVAADLQNAKASPDAIAERAYALVAFGEDHIFARDVAGTQMSVEALTMDDLKTYYEANLSPSVGSFRIVGDVDVSAVRSALAGIEARWTAKPVSFPDYPTPTAPVEARLYFYDVPGAKQSVLRFGHSALKRNDDDFDAATVMNYRLGGGGFASRLTQELRESKGYTYGVGSGFAASRRQGEFMIFSSVRSNVTLEATQLIKSILEQYGSTFTEKDLDVSKSFLLKSKARAFETLGAKLGVLQNVVDYDLPYDYVNEQDAIIKGMTVERIQELARAYVRPQAMNYVIVGDAETQAARLEDLEFGAPVMLNERLDALDN